MYCIQIWDLCEQIYCSFLQKQQQICNSQKQMLKQLSQWNDIEQYHSKCVCQTCSCGKHKCPKHQLHIPFQQVSSYQNDFIAKPINTWQKPPAQRPKPYQPYGNISSSYQAQFPGHKPQMREKIIPRVKNQNKDVPFQGQSEYKNKFPVKAVTKQPIRIKDKQFNPCTQPFQADTTYKSSYPKKSKNPHEKRKPQQYDFPSNYKFNGSTTYGGCYDEKHINPAKSCKPIQQLRPTGQHDLNTIYRKDFQQKKIPEPCPILKMPQVPGRLNQPNQHFVYNKNTHTWNQKGFLNHLY